MYNLSNLFILILIYALPAWIRKSFNLYKNILYPPEILFTGFTYY